MLQTACEAPWWCVTSRCIHILILRLNLQQLGDPGSTWEYNIKVYRKEEWQGRGTRGGDDHRGSLCKI